MQQRTPLPLRRENESTGMTALSGLPAYLDLAAVARLGESVRRHVGKRRHPGVDGRADGDVACDADLSGGESVDDLRLLESRGSGQGAACWGVSPDAAGRPQGAAQQVAQGASPVVPSPTAVCRYRDNFHDEAEEARRRPGRAFIPGQRRAASLGKVNWTGRVRGRPFGTHQGDGHGRYAGRDAQRQANYCYKNKAYQPLTTYWHEADLVVHSEFRDGT